MDARPTAVREIRHKHTTKWAVSSTGRAKGANAPFEIIARMNQAQDASIKRFAAEVKQQVGKDLWICWMSSRVTLSRQSLGLNLLPDDLFNAFRRDIGNRRSSTGASILCCRIQRSFPSDDSRLAAGLASARATR